MTSPITVAMTSHLSQMARNRSTFSGSTTAHMRSCDSLMRISSGESVESRRGTSSRVTRMPPEPLDASSDVAQERPAAPRSWMPTTSFSANASRVHSMSSFSWKGSPTWTAGRLDGFASSKVSEARIDAPPMPSPPVRAPYRMTLLPVPDAFARWMSSCRITPIAPALTSGFPW
ncbi:hypothetical protein QFZ49_003794 [Streptomyces turgidiscabies]|uniref:Uncharacterized protein n=1 Tax=Streptomyces turgidiscabies TaxID=85558 RepID=A0ABU0RPG8_9ACTN|nr:hypothetical protein [Streptomyces turgidiscabies]